ncbi:MAG: ABC transporter substrate-binding protein [Gemmatimonadetes bacterium]|nr:ABC transporter substrate-binding protein [Gemmatimonadota bacterium]
MLERPARRILSLVPAATEILVRLRAEDLLVGRTDYDLAPPSVARLPSVGGGLHPSVERILSLGPDLVIRFAAEADPATPERLDRLGITHFAIRPERIPDIRAITTALGALTARRSAADSLIREMDRRIAVVRRTVAGRPRPRVAYLLGGEPPRVVGPGTFINELIEIAGGTNIFADLGTPYPAVSAEVVLARRPDVILAPHDALLAPPPHGRLERVPSELFERPSPEVAVAAERLARILHADAFP